MSINEIFIPEFGSGFLRLLFGVFNIGTIVGAITLGAFLAIRLFFNARKIPINKNDEIPNKWKITAMAISTIVLSFLTFLAWFSNSPGMAVGNDSLDANTNQEIWRALINFLNPLLDLQSLTRSPIPHFFGLNLIARVLIIFLLVLAVKFAYLLACEFTQWFIKYQNDNIRKLSDGSAKEQKKNLFIKILQILVPGTSTIGVLAYIFGGIETRQGIIDIIDAIKGLFGFITVIEKIKPLTEGSSSGLVLANCFYFVLSISIITAYIVVGIILAVIIKTVWDNKSAICCWLRDKKRAPWILAGLLGVFLVLCVVFGYKHVSTAILRTYLGEGFAYESAPLKVFCLIIVTEVLVAAILFSFWFLVIFVFELFKAVPLAIRGGFRSAVDSFGSILMHFRIFRLFSFASQHAYRAAKSVVESLLRIFIGYDTEAQKNKGALVAACLASIASLLNTFLGLRSFYKDEINPIITFVCSLAIASAVQIAMLVFGMKAGEGLAEQTILSRRQKQREVYRAILAKCVNCIVYVLIYITLLIISLRLFFDENNSKYGGLIFWLIFSIVALIFLYACVLQIIDIIKLIRVWKKRERGESHELTELPYDNPDSDHSSAVDALSQPRIPFYVYLTAYLLFMIISTGFAYNNMYRYYAETAHVHQSVYDQIRAESATELGIIDTLHAMSADYITVTTGLRDVFVSDAAAVGAKLTAVSKMLESNVTDGRTNSDLDETGRVQLENRRDNFKNDTADFESVVSGIKYYIEALGHINGTRYNLYVHTYDHYWASNMTASYSTKAIEIKVAVNGVVEREIASYGRVLSTAAMVNPISTFNHPLGGTYNLIGRYKDTGDYSYAHEVEEILGTDKQGVIMALYGYYEELKSEIEGTYAAVITDDDLTVEVEQLNASGEDGSNDIENVYKTLMYISQLEAIVLNVALLGGGSTSGDVNIQDVVRIADEYLHPEESVIEESREGEERNASVAAKEAGFTDLTAYIERAKKLYNVLQAYSLKSTDGNERIENYEDESDEESGNDGTAQVDRFVNYAQGIKDSDFKLGFDTLFGGKFGLNPVADSINALYSSRTVAIGLLFICAIVDFMAFFVGLLLFKSVYLFRVNDKLKRVGYLNYETMLIDAFAVPKDKVQKRLHLAYIYSVLYGGFIEPETTGVLSELLNDSAFEEYKARKDAQIGELQTDDDRRYSADLLRWLDSYVKQNDDVDFSEEFSAVRPEEDEVGDSAEEETNMNKESEGTDESSEAESI